MDARRGIARWVTRGLSAMMLSAIAWSAHSAVPSFSVNAGTAITPANADAWYCAQSPGCTTSGTRQLWVNNYPVEITALARALHNDVDNIYEYVHNYIEIVPMYGLQKGALGALIHRSGTAFDQAQLMVELLRASGYTASYVDGAISLSDPALVQSWFGTNDAVALAAILADGGIPTTVTPATGQVTNVTLGHIWVKVTISGTPYVFDPSLKSHAFTSPINMATASGWNETTFLAAAQLGLVSGTQTGTSSTNPPAQVSIPYVSNVNAANITTQLTGYANTLTTYLRSNGYATKQIEDVIGRQDIQPLTGAPIRQTTLSYALTSNPSQRTWTGNIPDVYRTKLTVEMLTLNGSTVLLAQDLFADEVYGRRMYYDPFQTLNIWTNSTVQLKVDGLGVGALYTGSELPNNRTYRVRLSINHPYAASSGAYLDLTGANALVKLADFISPVLIVVGLGDTSDRLQAKLGSEQVQDKLLPPSLYFSCGPNGCENPDKAAQPAGETGLMRSYAGWLSQYTRLNMIQTRMRSVVSQTHHTLGVAYRHSYMTVTDPNASPEGACGNCWTVGQGATILDIDTAVSVNSKTAIATDRKAVALSLAASADTLEASLFEQVENTATPASVAHRFEDGTNASPSTRYFLLTQTANSPDPFPTGPFPWFYTSIANNTLNFTNAGYKVIAAQNEFMGPGRGCSTDPQPCTQISSVMFYERGGAFQAFGADGLTSAHIVLDARGQIFKGGSAGDPPNYDETYKPDKAADLLKDQFKDRSRDFGVDLASGDFTYSSGTDVSVGLGEFPYKLGFERTFKSGESHSPGLGKGWSHNLDIRMNLSSSGMEAMGQSSVLPAAASLMAIYATQQIYATQPGTDAALLQRWVVAPFIQAWWAARIRFNVATYTAASTSKVFVRLSDNNFNPPGAYNPLDGSSFWNLVQTGVPTITNFKYYFTNISFTLTSPSKEVQAFAYWGRPNHDLSQPYLYGPHHGWHVTTWTFPQGASLTFNYVPVDNVTYVDDHLSSVVNSLGRQLNFSFAANSAWDNCNVQSVNDNLGHSAVFNCGAATVTSPAGDVAKVSYGPLDCGQGNWPIRARRPQCSPYLSEVFGASSTTLPKLRLSYDEVGFVNTYADAVAVATPALRNPYTFYVTGGTRGERKDPAGFSYVVKYDPWTRMMSFKNELGFTSLAQYDGLNRVTGRTSAELIQTDFQYDPRGNVTQIKQTAIITSPLTSPATLTVSASYDTGCGKIKTVTDARLYVTTWNYNATTCTLTNVVQPVVLDGKTSTNLAPTTGYTYIGTGLIDTITDPTGVKVKYTYDASGNRTMAQVDSTGLNLQKTYGYDGVGNITSVTNGLSHQTGFMYDADRRVKRVTAPAATNSITENVWTGGLVTKVRRAKIANPNFATDTDWQVWLKSYSPSDKINVETDPNGGITDTDYDPVDRPEYVTQSIGPSGIPRLTRTQYDAAGQTFKIFRGWGTSEQITYAEYAYTMDGRQDWVKDANGNKTDLHYDGYGRLDEMIMPDKMTPGIPAVCHLPYASVDDCEVYGYDAAGNMTTKRNRSGKVVTMSYDALNRETNRAVPANAAGNYARTLTSTFDLAYRKWDLTADGQTLRNRYDGAGRLNQVQDSLLNALGGTIGNVNYGYDVASNRTSVAYDASQGTWTANSTYDTGERLSTVVNNGSTLAQFAYDPLSRLTSTTFLDSTSVGYAYEPDDDLQTLTHNYTGAGTPVTLGYTHNGAHQLIGMTVSDSNYLMKQVGASASYTPNGLNQYTQAAGSALTYDTNGNLSSDGSSTYSYDEENRLRQVVLAGVTSVYAYDPMGRRRSKTVAGVVTNFVSDGANELAELSAAGARVRFYLNGDGLDARIGMNDDPSAALSGWRFYHVNHQGSVLFTTRQSTGGAIADQYQYGAYGEPLTSTPLSGNPFRYTGRYLDAESGLYYYRARLYSTKLGRFLQTDPVGTKDDLNLYTYVGNDPLDKTDPMGLESVGEMIDSAAEGCGAASCAGWALAKGAWGTFGAEGVSQVYDKGSGASTGDKVSAVFEVGSAGFGGKIAAALRGVATVSSRVAAFAQRLAFAKSAMATIKSGGGKVIATATGEGASKGTVFRDAAKYAEQFGGQAGDYVKVSVTSVTESGERVSVHAVRNEVTGEVYRDKVLIGR